MRHLFIISAVLTLASCGQRGALFLPTEPAAAHRATLPQTILPIQIKKSAESSKSIAASPTVPKESADLDQNQGDLQNRQHSNQDEKKSPDQNTHQNAESPDE